MRSVPQKLKVAPNYLANMEESNLLVSMIADYWRERGCYVQVWLEETKLPASRGKEIEQRSLFSIRSDMVNGMPRNRRMKLAA